MSSEAGGRGTGLKEAYIDDQNLDSRASSWLASIEDYTRHPFSRDRLGTKPALLVMDMQRFFLEPSSPGYLPAGPVVLSRIKHLLGAFRNQGHPVIFTRHVDRPSRQASAMLRWWGHPMRPDDPLTELCPHLECGSREIHFQKNHYSAFRQTRLEGLLNQLGASTVVITGVLTHLCCESTARDAFMRDFDVVMVADATATYNETLHLSSLRGLAQGFASPALVRDVVNS
jgi:isochorismate hydrolase